MEQIYKSRPNQTSPQLNCDNDLGSASRPKLARTRQTTAPIPGVTGRHSAPYSLSAISSPMEIVCRKRTQTDVWHICVNCSAWPTRDYTEKWVDLESRGTRLSHLNLAGRWWAELSSFWPLIWSS